MIDYKRKYLKYKNKYINLKGGKLKYKCNLNENKCTDINILHEKRTMITDSYEEQSDCINDCIKYW